MQLEEESYLAHYGILRRSGRYPWGSGKNPHQRSKTFLSIIEEYEKQGMSQAEIAKLFDDRENGFPFTSRHIRALKTRAVTLQKEEQIRQAHTLRDKGMGFSEIGRHMNLNESTVRSLLEEGRLEKLSELQKTVDMLKRQVDEKGYVDVGAHVERDLPLDPLEPHIRVGISKDKFETALIMLQEEGYLVDTFKGPQAGTGEMTTYRGLAKPGTTQTQLWENRHSLQVIAEKSPDGGKSWQDLTFKKPPSIDVSRVAVAYKEDGGADADGVIYVRPGVKDVSIGKSQYAQVRMAVNGTHYLKGMAIYKDDLPPGVDVMFNTNKAKAVLGPNKLEAMKELKKVPLRDAKGNLVKKDGKTVDSDEVDWTNPFGSFPKLGGQILDKDGNVESAMNRLTEQGDWDTWSRNLSRQMLSKQKPELAEAQLALTHDRRRQEFETIKSLTNPLIKKTLLESFAEDTDSSAVHLKAANMPKQATKVIMPVRSMKTDEVFAPTLPNGTRVALVRFPHAGTFEIPELTVNNRNREANALFRQGKKVEAPDAIGIHPKVAERLSGADFDGDTVVLIPNNKGQIVHRPALEGLKNFDPQKYKVPTPKEDPVNGRYTITDKRKQDEMGKVTNLISDMTIRGASDTDLAKAVRHSMVVIDSEKHNLDFKASERENNIIALKKTYQGVTDRGQPRGASTLITKATSEARVPKRKPRPAAEGGPIDRATGKKMYVPTGEVDKHGNVKKFRSRKLAETDDAYTLVSEGRGTKIEQIYADHSNRLKALANEARKEMVHTTPTPRSKSAAKIYSKEVESLDAQLNEALKNAPLERRAQTLADHIVAQRKRANPDMEKSELKKIKGQALEEARVRTGAKKHRIDISDREWEAIQNGAISIDKLGKILRNTDVDKLKERATPREKPVMTTVMTTRAKQMLNSGATPAEVAEALGIPVSTLTSSLAAEGG